jgi:hypothetical protein
VKNKSKIKILSRIVLLICILTTAVAWTGCHRKIGLKPGEQLKKDKSQCKCKKRKSAIYSENAIKKTTFHYFKKSHEQEVKA